MSDFEVLLFFLVDLTMHWHWLKGTGAVGPGGALAVEDMKGSKYKLKEYMEGSGQEYL